MAMELVLNVFLPSFLTSFLTSPECMQPALRGVALSAIKSHIVRHTENVIQRLYTAVSLIARGVEGICQVGIQLALSLPPFYAVQYAITEDEGLGNIVVCATSGSRHTGVVPDHKFECPSEYR